MQLRKLRKFCTTKIWSHTVIHGIFSVYYSIYNASCLHIKVADETQVASYYVKFAWPQTADHSYSIIPHDADIAIATCMDSLYLIHAHLSYILEK